MTQVICKYKLEQIEDIIFNGFDFQLPADVIEKIYTLSMQVGAPDYVKTPVFKKREQPTSTDKKKKHGHTQDTVSDATWNSLKTNVVQSVSKTTLELEFDLIRSIINKTTDKNYKTMRDKIIEIIERVSLEHTDADLSGIGGNIFEIASSNKYYSKIYAELYADLSSKFEFVKKQYEENFNNFIELFTTIEYADPDENYGKFCEINKINEKRKSLLQKTKKMK